MKEQNLLFLNKCKIALLLLLTCLGYVASAQQPAREIKGTVTDSSGKKLEGISVQLKGDTATTISSAAGTYSIKIPSSAKQPILVFSAVNFLSRELAVGSSNTLNAVLIESTGLLDEVVVIGYGEVKRKDLTGAVSSVGAKQLKDVPVNSLAEALAGRLAGVQVVVSEGGPGAPVDIFVRGRGSITQSGSPLYVVDGVQVEDALSVLSPQDIETIDVLKDAASTAIYGARGANGVVIITTKGGRNTNGKISVSYNAFVGINKLTKELDMMDPYNFVLYQYEKAKVFRQVSDITSASRYIGNMDNFDTIASTYKNYPNARDWQKTMLGRSALQTTHNVSMSGGTANIQYDLSLTSNQQDGLLLNSDYNRKLVSFKSDQKISSNLKTGFNVRFNLQEINGAGTSDAAGAGASRLRQYTRYRPMLLPGEDDNSYDEILSEYNPGGGINLINPILNSQAEYRKTSTTVYNLGAYLNYTLVKGLTFRSTFGYDYTGTGYDSFDDTITTISKSNGRMPLLTTTHTVRATINNSNVFTYSNPQLFNNPKHNITVLLGQEIYESNIRQNSFSVRYFPVGTTPEIAFANLGLASPPAGLSQPKPFSTEVETRQVSFFSRINYTYNKKYLFSFNLRADGSSLFGPDYSSSLVASDAKNNKWGYFPSASLAWKLSDEQFFKGMKFISDAKIRLSYGTSGNNRIDAYGFTTGYIIPGNAGYGLNDILNYSLIFPTREGNGNIKWESLTSGNLGFDLGFFQNRLTASVDLYRNTTNNLLVENKVPGNTGFTTQYQNVGTMRNTGLEIQLGAIIVKNKNVSWNSSFNISFNSNKIISLGGVSQFTANSGFLGNLGNPDDYLVKVGGKVGTMYGLKVDGFYTTKDFNTVPYSNAAYPGLNYQYILKPGLPDQSGVVADAAQPGVIKYVDINKDGRVDLDSDRTVIGNALPKFTGGFNQQFSYKNFDMSLFFSFCYGNNIFNANKLEFTNAYGIDNNMLAIMNNRWKYIDAAGNVVQTQVNATTVIGIAPEQLAALNANAKIWTPQRNIQSFLPNSSVIEDGSYLRLSNVTIGYTFPSKISRKIKMSSLRVYATANNLLTITGYSGYDPDVSSRRSVLTPGVDYAAYPRGRTYVFGINVNFN